MRVAERCLCRVKRLEEIPAGLTLGIRVCLDARPVQTHDAICQDWEMEDVAVLNMGENDLSFQNFRSKIGRPASDFSTAP
jgi:hypothetical protein